jgi:hypothetical protein
MLVDCVNNTMECSEVILTLACLLALAMMMMKSFETKGDLIAER